METRSKRRRLLDSYVSPPRPDLPAIFESLNDDTLTTVLEFVGRKSYRSFGSVNKRCREVYLNKPGMTKETFLFGYGPLSRIIDRIERVGQHNYYTFLNSVGAGVVYHNRRDVMDWALEERKNGFLRAICRIAADEERFDLLEEVWSNVEDEESSRRCIFGDFCQFAARHGKLEILKWFGTKVLYFSEFKCASQAAEHGHLDIIQWLREKQGLKLGGVLYYGAIEGGHLHVMKWLKEKEVPFHERTFKCAAMKGNLEVLQWLHDEGCPWPKETEDEDELSLHEDEIEPEIVQWLHANGYGDRIVSLR